MNRIYLGHVEQLLKSDNQSRLFLSYMKIRNYSKGRCGWFNLEQLIECLQVSSTSARKALKGLIRLNYAKETKKGHYKINSFKFLVGNNLHERFYKITTDQLFSYSWKNISEFRALLVELKVQENRNIRKKLRKGYATIDRHGMREVVKSQSKKEFDALVASTYSAKLTGKSYSTILRYRKKQALVTYSKKEVHRYYSGEGLSMTDFEGGKIFFHSNSLVFVPISERFGKVKLNGY